MTGLKKSESNYLYHHGRLFLPGFGSSPQYSQTLAWTNHVCLESFTNNRIVRRGTSPQGYLGAGPRVGTDGVNEYKTPGMRESIRAQRGRARTALFYRVPIKNN